ncbi:efflux transporter, RND family, MFP subunit [Candidatus Vecturithrix granuli]|uniref:Efflux transporter, RND family, MFP subunit n=1 Tax=Vecturithrix granuli TaxID=1499967 RepID=A0A081BTN2_VECG1|nr:efflux transporter, RND family, MFP subunit [Candidatus Vecturithrix granuli]
MKRLVFIALLMAVCVLFMLSGCRRSPEQEVEAQKIETAVPVMVYVTQPTSISRYIKLTGGLEAENEALVLSKSGERIDKVLVKIGDEVAVDQVLILQSHQILQQGIAQAEAALRAANAQYEQARRDYARIQQLFQEKISSKQQFDQAQTQLKAAKSSVEQASALVKQAIEQYENSVVKAPIAGTVAMIFYEEGQIAPVGQPVIKITHTSAVKAKLYVPEIDLAAIEIGQQAIATFPAFPDLEFVGEITRLDEAVDPQKRALGIEVRIDNSHPLLRSGLFGQFLIETERHENALTITDTAVMPQTEIKLDTLGKQTSFTTYYVYVVENERVQKREVTPGIYARGQIEIISGLSAGEAIVVVGQNIVKEGDLVKIVETTE